MTVTTQTLQRFLRRWFLNNVLYKKRSSEFEWNIIILNIGKLISISTPRLIQAIQILSQFTHCLFPHLNLCLLVINCSLNLVNSWLNFKTDCRKCFNFKRGRFKPPNEFLNIKERQLNSLFNSTNETVSAVYRLINSFKFPES